MELATRMENSNPIEGKKNKMIDIDNTYSFINSNCFNLIYLMCIKFSTSGCPTARKQKELTKANAALCPETNTQLDQPADENKCETMFEMPPQSMLKTKTTNNNFPYIQNDYTNMTSNQCTTDRFNSTSTSDYSFTNSQVGDNFNSTGTSYNANSMNTNRNDHNLLQTNGNQQNQSNEMDKQNIVSRLK